MDCSPPGSSVYRILQARILRLDAIPSSRHGSLLQRIDLELDSKYILWEHSGDGDSSTSIPFWRLRYKKYLKKKNHWNLVSRMGSVSWQHVRVRCSHMVQTMDVQTLRPVWRKQRTQSQASGVLKKVDLGFPDLWLFKKRWKFIFWCKNYLFTNHNSFKKIKQCVWHKQKKKERKVVTISTDCAVSRLESESWLYVYWVYSTFMCLSFLIFTVGIVTVPTL